MSASPAAPPPTRQPILGVTATAMIAYCPHCKQMRAVGTIGGETGHASRVADLPQWHVRRCPERKVDDSDERD